jgi:hypothetical protein
VRAALALRAGEQTNIYIPDALPPDMPGAELCSRVHLPDKVASILF